MDITIVEQIEKLKKTQYIRMIEVMDSTKQLGTAVERKDDITVNILLSERQEPLLRLVEIDETIVSIIESQPYDDAVELDSVIHGAEPTVPETRALAQQVAKNNRLLSEIRQLDKVISKSIDSKKSFYNLIEK